MPPKALFALIAAAAAWPVVPSGPAWAEDGRATSPRPLCVVFDADQSKSPRCADRLKHCLPGEAAAAPRRATKTPAPPVAVNFAVPAAADFDARFVAEQFILMKRGRRAGAGPAPEEMKEACDSLSVFRYDLDGDKTDELFISLDSSGWCGSGGCFAAVFRRTGDGWVDLGEFLSRGLRIEKTKHAGFRDLSFTANGMRARLKWNGERYEEE